MYFMSISNTHCTTSLLMFLCSFHCLCLSFTLHVFILSASYINRACMIYSLLADNHLINNKHLHAHNSFQLSYQNCSPRLAVPYPNLIPAYFLSSVYCFDTIWLASSSSLKLLSFLDLFHLHNSIENSRAEPCSVHV